MGDCPDSAALDRLRTELYDPPIALDAAPGGCGCEIGTPEEIQFLMVPSARPRPSS